MAIIRLCRTYPRLDYPGIGLHCYIYTRYIKEPTYIFAKKMESRPVDIPSHAHLIEIAYRDIPFRREREYPLKLVPIIFSKIYGELHFMAKTAFYLRSHMIPVDIIHLHSINYLLTAIFLKRLFRSPVVMNFGGTEMLRLKGYPFLRAFLRNIDKGLYVSSRMKDTLVRFFHERDIRHIGNGVDLGLFRPLNVKRKRQFIAVGNLRWQKGFGYLIEAFKLLESRNPGYTLLIAGEGEDRVSLQSQIDALGLNQIVRLIGMQSRENIVGLLNTSRAFVMSSVTEGFPKALIEAISCGTPVIVTDAGECRSVAEGVGLVVPPKDSHSLADAMHCLITHNELWEEYATKCLDMRTQYDWKKLTAKVNEVYEDMRNGRSLPV
jgi:glycosyltransferase involved in cell wall biosynthesis